MTIQGTAKMGKRHNSKGFHQLMVEAATANYPNRSKPAKKELERRENTVYYGFFDAIETPNGVIWAASDRFKMFGTVTAEVIRTSVDGQRVKVRVMFAETGHSYGDFTTLHDIPLEELESRLLEEAQGWFGMFEEGYKPLDEDCVYVPALKRITMMALRGTDNLSPLREFLHKQKLAELSTHE